ncbi:MAG: site-2 protease family protein [Alphaproteobacteria bacterium]|nr:site-2 protease family protein [Alphaproteobacteria bacterium]
MLKLLFLILKAGKIGPVLMTTGTMLLSMAVYATIFGWRYAVGFVLLILVHEMGHFIAARQRGLNVGAPTFIPFVGAWIELKEMPHDVETEAYVGMAGPFAGTLGALCCYFAARHFGDDQLLLALSYAGFMINLFNLIPMSPLDGGRVTAILTPRVWLFGLPLLVGVFFINPSPLLILIGVMALPNIKRAWHYDHNAPENAYYRNVTGEQRMFYGCYYLMLVAFLACMSYSVHQMIAPMH